MAHGRIRIRLATLAALVVATAALLVAGASAEASTARHRAAAGVGGPLKAMMQAATGYSPSQVTSQSACSAPSPGRAGCDAEALVNKSTGQEVRPLKRALSAAASSAAATGLTVTRATLTRSSATLQSDTPDLYTPGYLQEAYDTGWLSQTAGVGSTVAIIDAYGDSTAVSDLSTFRSTYGLPTLSSCTPSSIASHNSGGPCLTVASQSGSTSALPTGSSWADEISLDLDAVSSLCPNCNILLIEAKSTSYANLATGDAEALKLGVKLISNSWGGPMSGDGGYFSTIEDNTGDQAGAETFASTGDYGAYVGDGYPGQTAANQTPYPASEPGITAVGGTTLTPSSNARGIAETAWSDAGSACSTVDTQPIWQAGVNTGCSGRAVADVSADADPATGLTIYDSNAPDNGWATYGGTSLAAPLTAAYVALTGVNSASTANSDGSLSAEWAYADASLLNDITAGSNGTCPPSTAYASPQTCNAGVGWDGPTGMGSISGDVVSSSAGPSLTVPPTGGVDNANNGYSIVQSLGSTTATFDGGVYPNGSATTVWWEYGSSSTTAGGTTFASASSTPIQSVGSGTAAVAATPATVSRLIPGAVYYVEECASNNSGGDTTCGNVTEFTTGSGPDASGAPTITASSLGYGGQLSLASGPTWTAGPTLSYEWQESSDGITWSDVSSLTASPSSYTLQSSDSLQYLRLELTAVNGSGTTTDDSNVLQAQLMVPAASTPALSDTSLGFGGQISVASPTWSPAATSVTYQWQQSNSGTGGWTNLTAASSSDNAYTIQLSDSQHYIRAAVVGTNGNGSTMLNSNPVLVQNLTPVAGGNPTIAATGLGVGGTLTVSTTPTWSPGVPTVSYQWQESVDGSSWSSLGSATATPAAYTIRTSDSQRQIRLAAIATDVAGTTAAYSSAVQVQKIVAVISSAPRLVGASSVGSTITVSGGIYENGGTVTLIFERCARVCTIVQRGTAASYKLRASDAGYYIVTLVDVAGAAGAASATTTATGLIGPVVSAKAGALRIAAAAATLRNGTGKALLKVKRTVIRAKAKNKPSTYVLKLTRVATIRGKLQAWACVQTSSKLVSCSRPMNVARGATIRTTVPAGDRIELVAVV